jgi:hypothetical protein
MMKRNKGKKALRLRKCLYYTVCLFAAGLLVLCNSCDKDVATSMEGTKWKLVGFVDAETGVLTEVVPTRGRFDMETGILTDGDPMDCEKCYKLTFVTDVEAQGRSVHNVLSVSFFEPIQVSSTNISFSKKPTCFRTKVGESPTPSRYIHALLDLTSYICYNNELKLFYNNNENYLFYKLIEQ